MNAPALIPVSTAQLPRTYEAAKRALSECSEVDECKDWADKAAALASYARQAEDDQLERMAQRIRARAIRRAGELLKQIDAQGSRTDLQPSVGDHTKFSQADAAREAGMSKHQQVQAVRIASIPEDDFEAQVESPKPPTLTQLAQQGIQRREAPPKPEQWLQGRDPKMFNRALHFTALVTEYAADLAKSGAVEILPHLDDGQRLKLRNALRQIDGIHDQIATRI
jgi:hypothetical protein